MQVIEGYTRSVAAIEAAGARRSFSANPQLEAGVLETCRNVRERGDEAILKSVRQFDCPTLTAPQLRVSPREIEEAWEQLPERAREALQNVARNVESFHRRQPVGEWCFTSPEGTYLGQRYTPIERVGLYAPNGRAAYPSTVLMLAIPARVAGVSEIVLVTPAGKDGNAHPVVLAAARVAGISEIYKVGGAAAAAALAYGTETVKPVDKIVGPGSIYFTLAKKHLYGTVGIDGLFGPSEVVVLGDEDALEKGLAPQLAANLLAQAEHGEDSFVCFIGPGASLCQAVLQEALEQIEASPRREILRNSLQNALFCQVASMEEGCQLANVVAAEHVEIWSTEAHYWGSKIRHAGAVFLNTPVPLGDYIAGPSHTLPTSSTARFASGVGVDTFLKRTSVVASAPAALGQLVEDLEVIALLEDLPGHAAAVRRAATS